MRAPASAVLLAIAAHVLPGCAATSSACPLGTPSDVSARIHDAEWDAPYVHAHDGAWSPSCKRVVSGPFLAPDFLRAGWVEDRGDHQTFVVGGTDVTDFAPTVASLTVGLDGGNTWFLLAPKLQLFVHAESTSGVAHWKGTVECPSCRESLTRYFDVVPRGPLAYAEIPDGDLALLRVPARDAHTRIFVLDSKTPAVAPTADPYLDAGPDAADGVGLPTGVRVWIGASIGPVFDDVRLDSFRREPSGAIRYEGKRGRSVHAVVDNVLGPVLRIEGDTSNVLAL